MQVNADANIGRMANSNLGAAHNKGIVKIKSQGQQGLQVSGGNTFQSARKNLMSTEQKIKQFLQILHFPEILSSEKFKYLTGCSSESFQNLLVEVKDVNPKVRERIFTRESAWLWALEKLRRNPPFEYAAISRNVSDTALSNIKFAYFIRYYI